MSDEMPFDVFRQQLMFLPDFLLVAFTEYTLSLVVAGKYRFCRMVLAYCDETTSRRKAVKDIM